MKDIVRTAISALIIGLLCAPLFAHHQLGLPHYLYSEDYPQIPTMVIDADAEGYTVTFSTYPGNPKPGEVVRMKIYIKHTLSGTVYNAPIHISVSTMTFFGGENQLAAPSLLQCEYNEYKMSYTFPEAEKYLINITFEPRKEFHEKIPFPIVIGQTDFNIIPLIFGVALFIVFIVVGFLKRGRSKESDEVETSRHHTDTQADNQQPDNAQPDSAQPDSDQPDNEKPQ